MSECMVESRRSHGIWTICAPRNFLSLTDSSGRCRVDKPVRRGSGSQQDFEENHDYVEDELARRQLQQVRTLKEIRMELSH